MAKFIRRYKSTIYGNWRRAVLIDGSVVGVLMSVVMALRDSLSPQPMAAPQNIVTDILLLVAVVWFSYQYRRGLPDQKVTLKELLLLGVGIGVVSGIVYGLWTWFNCSVLNDGLVEHYNQSRIQAMQTAAADSNTVIPESLEDAVAKVQRYTAARWGFIAGFRSAVLSVIIAFFTAILLRTEKGEIRTKN